MDKLKVEPWDIVKLKNHTGRYRVYKGSPATGDFIFACMDADVIRYSWDTEVVEILAGTTGRECPLPFHDRPTDFSARDCINAGECGCDERLTDGID